MKYINDYSDERHKSWCIHCSEPLHGVEANRDHIPTKGLLSATPPDNLPVIQICASCNSHFSLDEEYLIGFLSAVLSDSVTPDQQRLSTASRIFDRNQSLQRRIADARTIGGNNEIVWIPELARIKNVAIKNARGHAYYELGEPLMDEPTHVECWPIPYMTDQQRHEFEKIDLGSGWPEVGSRLMSRLASGEDFFDGWIVVEPNIYRYAVAQRGSVLVQSVIHEYLATSVSWTGD